MAYLLSTLLKVSSASSQMEQLLCSRHLCPPSTISYLIAADYYQMEQCPAFSSCERAFFESVPRIKKSVNWKAISCWTTTVMIVTVKLGTRIESGWDLVDLRWGDSVTRVIVCLTRGMAPFNWQQWACSNERIPQNRPVPPRQRRWHSSAPSRCYSCPLPTRRPLLSPTPPLPTTRSRDSAGNTTQSNSPSAYTPPNACPLPNPNPNQVHRPRPFPPAAAHALP